jgi:chitodextrinase
MVNAPSSASDAIRVPEADGKMRFWRNTSVATLASGAVATLAASTLGYEWDEALDNGFRPDGLIHLSSATYNGVDLLQDYGSTYASGTATHHLTVYKDSSGALVFGAGTVQWTWGLDSNHDRGSAPADGRMQQATINLFADMGVQPNTLQPGLAAATPSTDATAPVSAVSSPTAGASVQPGSLVTISGTASDIGGRVGGVEVSVDGGATWRAASGRGSWTYNWTTPSTSVTVTIKSRAVDDTGNLELPGAGVTVNVGSGSGSDATPPTAPGNLSASATSSTQINLTWTASTDNVAVTGYRVERCQGAGCSDFVQVAAPTAASYTDTGLTAETLYQYRVRATDAAANLSVYSNVANATTQAGGTTPGGLVAAYSFDEGAGTSASDASGNGHAGTITGATWSAGKFGNALSFNGANSMVSIADANDLDLGTAMTLSAWVNPAVLSDWRTVILKERPNGLSYALYAHDTARPAVYINTGGADIAADGSQSLPGNTWSHIAATYDGAMLRLYVNGSQVGSQSVTGNMVASASSLRIGGNTVWNEFFSGLIDEVRIYNRVLSAAEIQADSNTPIDLGSGSGSDTAPPTAPGDLNAVSASATEINLTWTASTDNVAVTGYRVERCQGTGCSNFVQVAAPAAASYTDTGLTAETNYRYRVRATDAAGNLSEYSAVASATTTAGTSNNTGFLNPTANTPVTSGAGDNNGFQTNPANAYASDGLFAVDTNSGTGTGTSCTGSGKDKHLYYNYGFNLPSGASVTGIEVRLNARADATSGNPRMCVQISWDGGSTWTAAKTTPTLTTSAATYTLGNSADTWGRAWTADNLSNANFRVRIINVASNTNRDFSLDWAGVQLTYQ